LNRILAVLFLLLPFLFGAPASFAVGYESSGKPAGADKSTAAEESVLKQRLPGVEFTKVQDLNPLAPADNRLVKQKWALVVGAARFKESRLTPLESEGMDRSAREFYDYLIDPQGGRFSTGHVKLLLNSSASRQNIMNALGAGFLGPAVGPDDLVVIYIATSAFPTTDGSTYLCAYDCALDNVYATCISMQNLMECLKKNVHCDRIVLVLQAAYSGAAELNSGAKALFAGYNIDLSKVVLGKGYVILSSSRPNEMTWGSSFSKNLIASLKLENGMIGLQKAFALAQQATEKETLLKNPDKKQTPMLKADWSGNELIIGTPPVEKVSDLPAGVLNFQSAEAQYLKATQALTTGKIDEALSAYKSAVEINPKYADALADYAAALTMKGDWQAAADLYARAVAAQSDDALFHLNYARVLARLGRESECQDELDRAYSLNPRDITVLKALSSRVVIYDPARAVDILKQALVLYPASADLHERLSYTLARAGESLPALDEARQAVKLDPASASGQINLGSALMYTGAYTEAATAYGQAVALSPDNLDAHYWLSRSLEKAGDATAARSALQEFLKRAPGSDPRAAAARKQLLQAGPK
jgi:tetratricopeptide (TPR) repeat protein